MNKPLHFETKAIHEGIKDHDWVMKGSKTMTGKGLPFLPFSSPLPIFMTPQAT